MIKKCLIISLMLLSVITPIKAMGSVSVNELVDSVSDNVIETSVSDNIIEETSETVIIEDEETPLLGGNEDKTEDESSLSQEEIDIKEKYKDFYSFIEKLGKLEEYAISYINDTTTELYGKDKLMYTYIREKRYNSSKWQYLAGKIDYNFNIYVKNKDTEIEKLKTLGNIKTPNEDTLDFIHMFAAMDMLREGYGNLGSWAGDLAQVIGSLKNITGTEEELYEKASKSINNESGYFSKSDMCADLDALNLYRRSYGRSGTLSELVEDYYLDLTNEERINEYVDNKYNFKTYNRETLKGFIDSEFYNDRMVYYLLNSYGVTYDKHSKIIRACLDVFIDYLYNNYSGEQVNNVEKEEPPKESEQESEVEVVIEEGNIEEEQYVEHDSSDIFVETTLEQVMVESVEPIIVETSIIEDNTIQENIEDTKSIVTVEEVSTITIEEESIPLEESIETEVETEMIETNEIEEIRDIPKVVVIVCISVVLVLGFLYVRVKKRFD